MPLDRQPKAVTAMIRKITTPIPALKKQISDKISSRIVPLIRDAIEQNMYGLEAKLENSAAQLGSIAKELNRLNDTVAALSATSNGLVETVAEQAGILRQVEPRLDAPNQATALLAAGHVIRAIQNTPSPPRSPVADASHTPELLDQAFKRLEGLAPAVYPIWRKLFDNAISFYSQDIEASASVWGHKYAQLFGAYVTLFGSGRFLDIGCGINGKPSYLASVPSHLVSGLEPLPQKIDPGFRCVQGFNEFLPWGDGAFDTVVSGTSLDHVLSLDKSLSEVVRVLAPQGRYLVWLASIPGSPAYNPADPDFAPRDQFHLFHFDRAWIEPVFQKYFEIQDVTIIPQPGFDHVFYCLTSKPR
jgi:SAM-dependent methyltransferase